MVAIRGNSRYLIVGVFNHTEYEDFVTKISRISALRKKHTTALEEWQSMPDFPTLKEEKEQRLVGKTQTSATRVETKEEKELRLEEHKKTQDSIMEDFIVPYNKE